jgi:KDO2-lipid IV(A) lauroyltransferase
MPIFIKLKGYEGGVIARRLYFHKYDKFIVNLRRRFDVPIIYRDESPKKILKVLKDGGVLGILADQDMDSVDGVFVDFFGRSAYTPTAPVKLGMVTGADLLPAFMIRKKDNTFKLMIEKPIEIPEEKGTDEDVKRYTQAWTDVLEKYIKKYPDQWVWLHPRWKTRPTAKEKLVKVEG